MSSVFLKMLSKLSAAEGKNFLGLLDVELALGLKPVSVGVSKSLEFNLMLGIDPSILRSIFTLLAVKCEFCF